MCSSWLWSANPAPALTGAYLYMATMGGRDNRHCRPRHIREQQRNHGNYGQEILFRRFGRCPGSLVLLLPYLMTRIPGELAMFSSLFAVALFFEASVGE